VLVRLDGSGDGEGDGSEEDEAEDGFGSVVDPEVLHVGDAGDEAVDDGVGFGSGLAGQFFDFAFASEGLYLFAVEGFVIRGDFHVDEYLALR
jgi:hypothetical protein